MSYQLHTGNCLNVMRTLADNSVDSVVTDPPYELGFMGKRWDSSGVAFDVKTWAEVLRVAKPGAYLLAFGGTRTSHRIACAIEDAGWEVRDRIRNEVSPETKYGPLWESLNADQKMALLELLNDQQDLGSELAWVYGSGFPKSHNGAWGGTALKPAHEPIIVARKPVAITVAANFAAHGTGGLNIDACRVGWPEGVVPEIGTPAWGGPSKTLSAAPGISGVMVDRNPPSQHGRWPANIIHDGSAEVVSAFPAAPGQMANAKTEGGCKTRGIYGAMRYGREGEASAESANDGAVGFAMKPGARRLDTGSAARFFYCAKASRSDREAGCEEFAVNSGQFIIRKGEAHERPMRANTHPTVKPTELMRYLCRLVTPAGGIVLDPFMGSGSTGRGAMLEGFKFIGIEQDPDYTAIADARVRDAFLKVAA